MDNIENIEFDNKEGFNIIIGQSHFIKTVEDLYEALVTSSPSINFGIAFNEASGDRLIRYDGNDEQGIKKAIDIARKIGAGHLFCVVLTSGYPINVLNKIKEVNEIVSIYIATANPFSVVVYRSGERCGVLGVVDGYSPRDIEKQEDKEKRHKFLRDIGYKR